MFFLLVELSNVTICKQLDYRSCSHFFYSKLLWHIKTLVIMNVERPICEQSRSPIPDSAEPISSHQASVLQRLVWGVWLHLYVNVLLSSVVNRVL